MNIDVPQIVRADAQDKNVRNGRQMTHLTMYQPPLDGTKDEFRAFDNWAAGRAMIVLTNNFPGYPWDVVCDCRQGVVHFGIRVLMGKSLRWVIRLGDWADLDAKLVRDCGGQLLERFNLPRTGFEVASFLKARDNKHLADVVPIRRKFA